LRFTTKFDGIAAAGYKIGLTIAPIMPIPDWRNGYRTLLSDVATAVSGVADVDLTVECITHRFTAGSKNVLLGWYPRTMLEMDESVRTRKSGKYGSAKYVYPKDTMAPLSRIRVGLAN
jgi:spore photoproduct lyase